MTNLETRMVLSFKLARKSRTKVPCRRSALIQSEVERKPFRLAMKNRTVVEPAKRTKPSVWPRRLWPVAARRAKTLTAPRAVSSLSQ